MNKIRFRCKQCSKWFWGKLGRCLQCLIITPILFLGGVYGWFYFGNIELNYINKIISQFACFFGLVTTTMHYTMFAYYKIGKKEIDKIEKDSKSMI